MVLFYYFCLNIVKINYYFFPYQVGENKKKDKKEDDSLSQNQTNDPIDTADEISNGVVAKMETEKIDTK